MILKGYEEYMKLEELEEAIITELAKREIDIEIAKIVFLKLMDNETGQKELLQYIMNTEEITEENLMSKVREISK